MNDSKKQVLIVDNATTCAMRIKTLVNIHGAIAKIIHWSDWEHFLQQSSDLQPCLVVVEETVPRYVIESIVEHLPTPPFFLLINTHSKVKDWGLNKPINPLLSSLSNFEIIALLEPYWSEEKSISLPSVLILDDNPTTSFKINEDLSEANIPCRVSNRIESAYLNDIDMLLVNMSELDKRQRQIVKVKGANPSVGVITYCESSNIADIKFVQFALNHQLDLALTIEQLNGAWVAEFYRVWRQKAESRDRQLVAEQVESSLDKLLEKSLVMQVLFANSMDGVVSFTEDGQILRFNNGFCE